jgi:hypothetical protein
MLADDMPWEKAIGYCSVHRNAETGQYQLWYQALASVSPESSNVCYAESADGVHWVKPNLGLFPFRGMEETNIVVIGGHSYGASVVYDPRDPDPAKRFKMARFELPDGYDSRTAGLYVYFSPDGISWKREPRGPLLKGAFGGSAAPPLKGQADPRIGHPLSTSDVIDAMLDPQKGRFVIYAKTWIDGPDGMTFWKRAVTRTESDDFVHWSRPQLMMVPDEYDGTGVEYESPIRRETEEVHAGRRGVQLHSGPVFFSHGVYFALLQVMDGEVTGEMPIELAVSRDGMEWSRPFREERFLDVTHDRERFDGGAIWSNATPVFLENETRFYYGAYSGLWKGQLIRPPTGVGMAVMLPDRYAAIRPRHEIGQITLKPMPLEAFRRGVTVNADASTGSILVEVLTEDGYRLMGSADGHTHPLFTRDLCVPIHGDSLRHPVRWKDSGPAFDALPPGKYMLRLHLQNAEVFAVEMNCT